MAAVRQSFENRSTDAVVIRESKEDGAGLEDGIGGGQPSWIFDVGGSIFRRMIGSEDAKRYPRELPSQGEDLRSTVVRETVRRQIAEDRESAGHRARGVGSQFIGQREVGGFNAEPLQLLQVPWRNRQVSVGK